jgi:hypothetical protein
MEHGRQLAPETTGAGCWDCTGGAAGGESCLDAGDVPVVEDPVEEVLAELAVFGVVACPGRALLR